jgi:hypothetical protein
MSTTDREHGVPQHPTLTPERAAALATFACPDDPDAAAALTRYLLRNGA